MTETPTPETDANMRRCEAVDSHGVFPLEYVRLDFARQLERRCAELEALARENADRCTHCPDQGWFPDHDPHTGDPVQVQCEFCYTAKNSLYSVECRLEEIRRKYGG